MPRPVVGDLVQLRDGRWITWPPTHCGKGHRLGPQQTLVGHVACRGHQGGGHTSWHCRQCDDVTFGPPMEKHCTAVDGPAAVRISSALPEPEQPYDPPVPTL